MTHGKPGYSRRVSTSFLSTLKYHIKYQLNLFSSNSLCRVILIFRFPFKNCWWVIRRHLPLGLPILPFRWAIIFKFTPSPHCPHRRLIFLIFFQRQSNELSNRRKLIKIKHFEKALEFVLYNSCWRRYQLISPSYFTIHFENLKWNRFERPLYEFAFRKKAWFLVIGSLIMESKW